MATTVASAAQQVRCNEMAWLSVIVVGLAVVSWIARRALRRDGRRCPSGHGLYPECLYRVSITDDEIQVAQPNGNTETVPLRALAKVVLETNDSGPGGGRCMVALYGGPQTVCSYPQGATGEDRASQIRPGSGRFQRRRTPIGYGVHEQSDIRRI